MKKMLIAMPIISALILDLIIYAHAEHLIAHTVGDITNDLIMHLVLAMIISLLAIALSIIINKKYINPKPTRLKIFLLIVLNILIVVYGLSFFILIHNS